MERLRQNCLPQLPTNLFESDPGHIKLLHINIGNVEEEMERLRQNCFLNYPQIYLNLIQDT